MNFDSFLPQVWIWLLKRERNKIYGKSYYKNIFSNFSNRTEWLVLNYTTSNGTSNLSSTKELCLHLCVSHKEILSSKLEYHTSHRTLSLHPFYDYPTRSLIFCTRLCNFFAFISNNKRSLYPSTLYYKLEHTGDENIHLLLQKFTLLFLSSI